MNKNRITKVLAIILSLTFLSSSCEGSSSGYDWEWEWDKESGDTTPVSDKPMFIWISSGANFDDFANSKDNIERDLRKAKEVGFTDIVVDVRPTGDVLFKTDKADYVTWLGAWKNGSYTKIERNVDWDYLEAFIEIGHKLDLRIYAGVNTFLGGQKNPLGELGPLFKDPSKKNWATELLTNEGIVNAMDNTSEGGIFLNPANKDVQNYLFGLLEDLAANYPNLDGIILDRGRYQGLNSDFSNESRIKFEEYIGQKVENFPQDIMSPSIKEGSLPSPLPKHFKKWLEFRVKVIHDFMAEARDKVKAKNPNVKFGVYVGGWYSSYYGTGVNWASKNYNVAAKYPTWATADYKNYGYADLMDVIIIGAYASPDRVIGTTEWTIQGFCSSAKDKIMNDAMVVGGPDIGNANWANNDNQPTYNKAIVESVGAVMDVCDGYYLFDMIHLKNRNQWQYVREGLDKALKKDGK